MNGKRPVAVSNIAWARQEDDPFLDILAEEGAKGVELAASLVWDEPVDSRPAQRALLRESVESRGLKIIGLHALLFTREDIQLLDVGEGGQRTRDYLKQTIDLCAELGGASLVLGSPRNRHRGDLALNDATRRCVAVLNDVGDYAVRNGCYIALEALPAPKCDFITNLHECAEVVRLADTPGVQVHLDTGAADITEIETPKDELFSIMRLAQHCHVNDFELLPPGSHTPQSHLHWARLLDDADYSGWMSIEMRSLGSEEAKDAVRNAVRFVKAHYCKETP